MDLDFALALQEESEKVIMDLTKVPKNELMSEIYKRLIPDGITIASAPLLPSDTTFTTVDPPNTTTYPVYVTPTSDCTLESNGVKIDSRLCCTHEDALAVAKELGAPGAPYIFVENGAVQEGSIPRMPYCITLATGQHQFNCQTYIEQKNFKGVGAPYIVDVNGQVHFTAAVPVNPWDTNNPNPNVVNPVRL